MRGFLAKRLLAGGGGIERRDILRVLKKLEQPLVIRAAQGDGIFGLGDGPDGVRLYTSSRLAIFSTVIPVATPQRRLRVQPSPNPHRASRAAA